MMDDDTTEYTFLEPWRGCLSDEQIAAGYAATAAQAAQWADEAANDPPADEEAPAA